VKSVIRQYVSLDLFIPSHTLCEKSEGVGFVVRGLKWEITDFTDFTSSTIWPGEQLRRCDGVTRR
jgi:hypothetical protein